jgi:hypothetical protein
MSEYYCIDGVVIRPVLDCPGYFADTEGNVYSQPDHPKRRRKKKRPKDFLGDVWLIKLSPGHHPNGYLQVNLTRSDGSRYTDMIHRIVMRTFVGPPPSGMEVCHEDNDKSNNRLSNLRYGTHASNQADMARHGASARGHKNYNTILTPEQVQDIRRDVLCGMLLRIVALKYRVCAGTVSAIMCGKVWSHLPLPPDLVGVTRPNNQSKGTDTSLAKMSEITVREIRRCFANGESQPSLAARFGISQTTVSCIVLRKTWKHVD